MIFTQSMVQLAQLPVLNEHMYIIPNITIHHVLKLDKPIYHSLIVLNISVFILMNCSRFIVKYHVNFNQYTLACIHQITSLYRTQFHWKQPLPWYLHSYFHISITETQFSLIFLITSLKDSKLHQMVLLGIFSNL